MRDISVRAYYVSGKHRYYKPTRVEGLFVHMHLQMLAPTNNVGKRNSCNNSRYFRIYWLSWLELMIFESFLFNLSVKANVWRLRRIIFYKCEFPFSEIAIRETKIFRQSHSLKFVLRSCSWGIIHLCDFNIKKLSFITANHICGAPAGLTTVALAATSEFTASSFLRRDCLQWKSESVSWLEGDNWKNYGGDKSAWNIGNIFNTHHNCLEFV